MTENSKKEIHNTNDTKVSTDTLYVLLLVICGIAGIILVAYLLYNPQKTANDVVIRDIVVSGAILDESENIESVEDSLENSYLAEEKSMDEIIPEPQPIITETKVIEPIVIEKTPIFKSEKKVVLKQTPVKTTLVKESPKEMKLITVQAFWIQVGSFSTSAVAAKSVDLLKERGLSSRVVLKTVNGKSVYRVRIGAYESKDEADKFAVEVKKIEGFEESYVSETTTQKYVEL